MLDHDTSGTVDLVIVSANCPKGVVLRSLPKPPDATLEALRALVREKIGVDAVLLHDGGLALGVESEPVLMEALNDLPPELVPVTITWSLPPNARPWQRPGWFLKACGWLEDALVARGEEVTGNVRQVSTYDLACVLRADTSGGGVYVKAGSAREVAVTAYLAKAHSGLTPAVLAQNSARGWLLTRDGGKRLSETADLTAWSAALSQLAFRRRRTQPLSRISAVRSTRSLNLQSGLRPFYAMPRRFTAGAWMTNR